MDDAQTHCLTYLGVAIGLFSVLFLFPRNSIVFKIVCGGIIIFSIMATIYGVKILRSVRDKRRIDREINLKVSKWKINKTVF